MTEKVFHVGQRVVATVRLGPPPEIVHGTITGKFYGYTSANYYVAYDTNNEDHGRWFKPDQLESEAGNPA